MERSGHGSDLEYGTETVNTFAFRAIVPLMSRHFICELSICSPVRSKISSFLLFEGDRYFEDFTTRKSRIYLSSCTYGEQVARFFARE